MSNLPLFPFLPLGPAVVPYKARGVFTPCPTPLPSSGAFLGQADVPSLALLDRLLSLWRRLACPWQAHNPFAFPWYGPPLARMPQPLCGASCGPATLPLWPWLVALAGSPALVVFIEQTKGHLQKIIL